MTDAPDIAAITRRADAGIFRCDDIPALLEAVKSRDAKFVAHTAAVQTFLQEMVAVYDPCNDAEMDVQEACRWLVKTATDMRQVAEDQCDKIAELEKREAEARAHLKQALSLADWYAAVMSRAHSAALEMEPEYLAAQSWLASSGATEADKCP